MGTSRHSQKKATMLVYQDVKTGEEMLNGNLLKVKASMITIGGDDFQLEGANPSAEDGDDDGGEAATEQVIDIISAFKLQETEYKKKEYMGYIKNFIKTYMVMPMKEAGVDPEEIAKFKTDIMEVLAFLTAKGTFDEFRFWTSEEMDCEGNICMLYYGDSEGTMGAGAEPWFYYIAKGMKKVKF